MTGNLRRKNLISQHIQVALIYKEMLGADEAMAYLDRAGVSRDTAERVVLTEQRRRLPAMPAPLVFAPAPYANCRRRNRVQDAIVEAALKIERKLGTELALELLKSERVPAAVVARVAAPGPRQVRARAAHS